jgi:hypothetical protein
MIVAVRARLYGDGDPHAVARQHRHDPVGIASPHRRGRTMDRSPWVLLCVAGPHMDMAVHGAASWDRAVRHVRDHLRIGVDCRTTDASDPMLDSRRR